MFIMRRKKSVSENFEFFIREQNVKFKTVLADPPWKFSHGTGKVSPEHKRLNRYPTLTLPEIMSIPVSDTVGSSGHLYLWVPNALISEGLQVMESWGFIFKIRLNCFYLGPKEE
jgi:N6-adenosine-specific RNA methylase IME4